MTKLFLIKRKSDNHFPIGDGIDGAIVLAADAAAAIVAAKALTPGDPDGAWASGVVDTYDLSGTAFVAGSIPFTMRGTIVAPA